MKTRELRDRLLVALYVTAQSENLGEFLDTAEVANAYGFERRPGQLRLIVDELDSRGIVQSSKTLGSGDEGGLDLMLTYRAVEEAEELLEKNPEYASPVSHVAPGSDRYVTLSDNQRTDIVKDVQNLKDVVCVINHVGEEERKIALSEIAIFEAGIAQACISAELIDRFVRRILTWIQKTFGDALVGAVAGALVAKLLPFLAP